MIQKTIEKLMLLMAAFLGLFLQASPAFAATLAGTNAFMATSSNWSGYVANGRTYTGVGGTWNIPAVDQATSAQGSSDATWVGIGGLNSTDLIQTGTIANVSNGRVYYQAWYELLPSLPVFVPLAVYPGNTMVGSITLDSPNMWTISLTNAATNQNYTVHVNYASSQGSADWVEEAPKSTMGPFLPLDNFGTVSFRDAWAVADNVRYSPSDLNAQPLAMTDTQGSVIARPGTISSNGASFDISRSASQFVAVLPTPVQAATTTISPTQIRTITYQIQTAPRKNIRIQVAHSIRRVRTWRITVT